LKIIIIGNGAAGMAAAEAVRERDADSKIIIYSAENRFHYSRPRIIEFLGGSVPADTLTIRPAGYYEKHRIKLMKPVKVEAIDPVNRNVILEDGRKDSFEKLIIAAGAEAFLPPVEGSDLEGVFTLRTLDDAEKIMAFSKGRNKAVIVGGGLLGIETAANIAKNGLDTVVVELSERLLPRQLDADSAEMLRFLLEKRGLEFLLARKTAWIRRSGPSLELGFADGSSIGADIVIFSSGIRSAMGLARAAGIFCERGIIVDEFMETNLPGIYAAGDVAQFKGTVYGLWPAAKEQGTFAGRNAAGEKAAYSGSLVSARLKVSGIELASLGSIEAGDGVSVISSRGDNSFKRLFMKEGRLIGAILIGGTADYMKLQKLVKSEEIVGDPGSL
jgi:nitrite reductase (NADH) large subunit